MSISELDKDCNILKTLWEEFEFSYESIYELLEKFDFETILGVHFAIGYLNNFCELNNKGEVIINQSKNKLIEFLKKQNENFDESDYLNV